MALIRLNRLAAQAELRSTGSPPQSNADYVSSLQTSLAVAVHRAKCPPERYTFHNGRFNYRGAQIELGHQCNYQ